MKTLLFVAADRREFSGVLRHSKGLCRVAWRVDFARDVELSGDRVFCVANGPGPELAEHAVRTALNECSVAVVVSIGYCGALNPALRLADVVVATEVASAREPAGRACVLPRCGTPYRAVRVWSQNRVAATVEEKRSLWESGFDVVEMEAEAVARAAGESGARFACVRVVSDAAGESFGIDLNKMRTADGHFSRGRIVAVAARHPVELVPELLRFAWRSRQASAVLGDFIADCEF